MVASLMREVLGSLVEDFGPLTQVDLLAAISGDVPDDCAP